MDSSIVSVFLGSFFWATPGGDLFFLKTSLIILMYLYEIFCVRPLFTSQERQKVPMNLKYNMMRMKVFLEDIRWYL